MPIGRLSIVLLLSAAALVATVVPALAHAELIASTPADGETLPAAPRQIELMFDEPVTLPPDPVTVTGPDGGSWSVGAAGVAATVVTAPVQPSGPAGSYTLAFRVYSKDGDPVSGAVRFTLAAPVDPTTTSTTTPLPATTEQQPDLSPFAAAQPADTDEAGIPTWMSIAGAVVLLVIGLLVAWWARRSSRT